MIREFGSHQRIADRKNFLEKFKGKVNKVSKLGVNQVILSEKTEAFQSFQENCSSIEFKGKEKRLSLGSGKLQNFPSVQSSSKSQNLQGRLIKKSLSVGQIKKENFQKLPKISGQNQLQRRLSLQGRSRQSTKNEQRINKIIKTAIFQNKSKYKSWKAPIDVSQDNLRFFKFTTGMSKLKSRQSSDL